MKNTASRGLTINAQIVFDGSEVILWVRGEKLKWLTAAIHVQHIKGLSKAPRLLWFLSVFHTVHLETTVVSSWFICASSFSCSRSERGTCTVATDSWWTTHGARRYAGWHRGPHQVMEHFTGKLIPYISRTFSLSKYARKKKQPTFKRIKSKRYYEFFGYIESKIPNPTHWSVP